MKNIMWCYFIAIVLTPIFAKAADVDQKTFFLTPKKSEIPWKGVKKEIQKSGNVFMPTGFTFDAVLTEAIYSFNLLTPAIAEVDEDIYFLDQLVIPRKSRFIGLVQVVHSIDRVNINFHTLIFPNGQEITLQAMALWHEDGSAGVKGKVENHKDAVAARIALKSVLTAVSASAQLAAPGPQGAMLSGFSQEAQQSIDTEMGKVTNLESIFVQEKTPIKMFLMKRLDY